MSTEPQHKFWIEPTRAELAEANVRLKSWLVAMSMAAIIGWGFFLFMVAHY